MSLPSPDNAAVRFSTYSWSAAEVYDHLPYLEDDNKAFIRYLALSGLGRLNKFDGLSCSPPITVNLVSEMMNAPRSLSLQLKSEPSIGNQDMVQFNSGVYDYSKTAGARTFWVNFADPDLFAHGGTPHFAQDQWMISECPCLTGVRSLLLRDHCRPISRTTLPVAITGVRRHIAVDGSSFYGKLFREQSHSVLYQHCKILRPPSLLNILTLCAPQGQTDSEYTMAEIEYIFDLLYTGFRVAVQTNTPAVSGAALHWNASLQDWDTSICTGNLGCGVFGGNLRLMSLLTLLAGRAARVRLQVFAASQRDLWVEAHTSLQRDFSHLTIEEALKLTLDKGFRWMVSNKA